MCSIYRTTLFVQKEKKGIALHSEISRISGLEKSKKNIRNIQNTWIGANNTVQCYAYLVNEIRSDFAQEVFSLSMLHKHFKTSKKWPRMAPKICWSFYGNTHCWLHENFVHIDWTLCWQYDSQKIGNYRKIEIKFWFKQEFNGFMLYTK